MVNMILCNQTFKFKRQIITIFIDHHAKQSKLISTIFQNKKHINCNRYKNYVKIGLAKLLLIIDIA